MRAPFQILAIPYRIINGECSYCVFRRADLDCWQFVSGGGEDGESSLETAKREVMEECGVDSLNWVLLKSMSCIPVAVIAKESRQHWSPDQYVIPEYAFGFECTKDIKLSPEHIEAKWMSYEKTRKILQWDSNHTALYELHCRLMDKRDVM